MIQKDYLILGAGLAGLSAAYHARGKDFMVVEKSPSAGGLCTTETKNGFSFDQTGHWLHMKDERTKKLFNTLFNDAEVVEIVRKTWIFSHGVYTQYPFQSNTYGLPPQVIKECLLGFAEAWKKDDKSRAGENFYEWCMAWFGKGISNHFMIPYNTKIYTVHPKEYASHWCDAYIPKPTIDQVIEGAVTAPEQKDIGYNATFKYPKDGGIGELPKRLFEKCEKEKFLFGVEPISIDAKKRTALLSNGETVHYKKLISTIPLRDFLRLFSDDNAPLFQKIADRMKIASVSYLNVATKKPLGHDGHWFYIPENKFMPYRIGSFSNIYSKLALEGRGSAYVEYTHQGEMDKSVDEFRAETVKMMVAMKLIESENDIDFMDYRTIVNGYVIYHNEYFDDMKLIKEKFKNAGIKLAGRYANWTYSAMENAIIEGLESV
ncbi:FAD-dependent oxidoreductase [bacterium]|nr:FAD-dependent oxidoreductase [bacterium]